MIVIKKRLNYNHTIIACYFGYITQAIVNNFVPLLLLTFQSSFGISVEKLSYLLAFNFCIQLFTDLVSSGLIKKIGYRISIVSAHFLSALGLVGLAVFTLAFSDPYKGLMLAIGLYAIGGGLIEVLISPIVEACPTEKKEATMGILHSFYCWGCMSVVLLSTLFFVTIGINNWRILAFVWALIPIIDGIFFAKVPIQSLEDVTEGGSLRVHELVLSSGFWILVLLMICSGASELGMAQWISAFTEKSLKVSKTMGDLLGTCIFALTMGISRSVYAKIVNRKLLRLLMIVCAAVCFLGYLLASMASYTSLALLGCGICGLMVGVMWPGTFSISRVVYPRGGTALFAFLALAGDLGGSIGPLLIGKTAGIFNGDLKKGLLCASLFPAFLVIGVICLGRKTRD